MWKDERVSHAARDLMGFYGIEGGYRPGGFTSALIVCMEKADQNNFNRLAEAFPEMGEAARVFSNLGEPSLRLLADLESAR